MAKKIYLRPYPGVIVFCASRREYAAMHKRYLKRPAPDISLAKGRVDSGDDTTHAVVYIVWAENFHALAHEVCHVALHLFDLIGTDPRGNGQEPFCYLVSQILLEMS